MLDFGALPPEINSARIYSGPGSAPMMAAASAWDALAAQLEMYAAGYSRTLSELQSQWAGASSMRMASAIAPHLAWATTTAAQAEQTATQARMVAAAYETAFAATVPPPVIAANRIELGILVATNFFGQNTPAIAAHEAEYAAMWAQDAAAMYGYAAASSAASTLTPFSEPPHLTNSGGRVAQAAAVTHAANTPVGQSQATISQVMSVLPQQLQTLATGTPTSAADPAGTGLTSIVSAFSIFNTLVTNPAQPFWSTTYSVFSAGHFGTGNNLLNLQLAKQATAAASKANMLTPAGIRGPALASVGKAVPVGKLSVPQSWVTSNPVASPASDPVLSAGADLRAVPVADATPPGNALGGFPMGRAAQRDGVPILRNGRRIFKMPRPLYGG
jgi:PPE-repeat protein